MKILLVVLMATALALRSPDQSLFDKMQNEQDESKTLKVKSLESDFVVNNSTTTSSLDMAGLHIENNLVHISGDTLLQLDGMRLTGDQLQGLLNYYHLLLTKCGKDLEKCQPGQEQAQMRFQQKKANWASKEKVEKAEKKEEKPEPKNTKTEETSEDQLDDQVDALLD